MRIERYFRRVGPLVVALGGALQAVDHGFSAAHTTGSQLAVYDPVVGLAEKEITVATCDIRMNQSKQSEVDFSRMTALDSSLRNNCAVV